LDPGARPGCKRARLSHSRTGRHNWETVGRNSNGLSPSCQHQRPSLPCSSTSRPAIWTWARSLYRGKGGAWAGDPLAALSPALLSSRPSRGGCRRHTTADLAAPCHRAGWALRGIACGVAESARGAVARTHQPLQGCRRAVGCRGPTATPPTFVAALVKYVASQGRWRQIGPRPSPYSSQ